MNHDAHWHNKYVRIRIRIRICMYVTGIGIAASGSVPVQVKYVFISVGIPTGGLLLATTHTWHVTAGVLVVKIVSVAV
jgi:hypothetical protein